MESDGDHGFNEREAQRSWAWEEARRLWQEYRAIREQSLYGDDRLAGGGGYEGPRHNRVPLPVEITSVIADAEQATKMAASGFGLAPCGAQAPGTVSGTDIRCDRLQGHTAKIKHRNRQTGFSWWGEH